MNVLFLSTWFPWPPDNGSKIRVYYLLRALSEHHQVTLASFAFGTAEPNDAHDPLSFCAGVHVVRANPFDGNRTPSVVRFLSPDPVVTHALPQMSQTVRELFSQEHFDVVIASIEVVAVYAFLAPDPTAMVLEEHNSLARWMWDRYRLQTSPLQRLRCWVSWRKSCHYEARLFPRFDLCTMVSEIDRNASLEMLPGYRGPVEVIPNGVDCQRNRPGLAQPKPDTLIFNGALTYYANHDAMRYFLAEIYPGVRQQVSNASLTITGDTSGVRLTDLQLDDSVHLSGYVDDIRPVIAGATVCVVPLRQGSGTRLKILEAMALGTPVIATTKGAEGLDVTPGQDILIADEPTEFGNQVIRLLRDAALREQLAFNARRLVERCYDWQQIGRNFVNLVEAAANKPHRKRHDDR